MHRTTNRIIALAVGALVGALALAGCSGSSSTSPGTPAASTQTAARTLTVFAAASLKSTFSQLGAHFESDHPGVKVTFNFAGSQDLAAQITQGAKADVFASANEKQMKVVTDAGLGAGTPTKFATNSLEIAVPPGNPAGIASFQDLAKPGVKVVVCAAAVPCGAATQTVEQATGVKLTPVSEEQAVTDVLAKITSGEADAGLVYKTDVVTAGSSVQGVPFPEATKAVNNNPIVALKNAQQAELASAFVSLVLGEQGQKVLTAAGFGGAQGS